MTNTPHIPKSFSNYQHNSSLLPIMQYFKTYIFPVHLTKLHFMLLKYRRKHHLSFLMIFFFDVFKLVEDNRQKEKPIKYPVDDLLL